MTAQAEKTFFVSITASQPRVVLYVGMTSDLAQRAWQHRERDSGELASRRGRAMKW